MHLFEQMVMLFPRGQGHALAWNGEVRLPPTSGFNSLPPHRNLQQIIILRAFTRVITWLLNAPRRRKAIAAMRLKCSTGGDCARPGPS